MTGVDCCGRIGAVINVGLIEARLKEMGLISVWKAFAVEYLGMPGEAMPLYSV